MKTNFPKPYSTSKQIVQILKSRRMYFSDEDGKLLANVGCQELGDKYWITKVEYFANAEKFRQTLAVYRKGTGFK